MNNKTLVLSNSYDVTTDLLMEKFTPKYLFRMNFDQWDTYGVNITREGLSLSSMAGMVTESDISKVLWRKPFNEGFEVKPKHDEYLTAEAKYYFREIYNLLAREGKRIFNWPSTEQRLGKMVQLRVAEKYFNVPRYKFLQTDEPYFCEGPTIVKSLASHQLSSGNVIYTSDVSGKTLAPSYPWLIQDIVRATFDITVVYVLGKMFAYRLDRSQFVGLDWREHAIKMAESWESFALNDTDQVAIINFMGDLGINFGRLDFLAGDGLVFLEVNPNGQWAWLDRTRNDGLFNEICACIDPETSYGLRS